uniref:Uncharacterized protein n=1 Tax=Panagrellus redivivus TaxID=6233 RepID=A0A7E4ZVP2_PANRE
MEKWVLSPAVSVTKILFNVMIDWTVLILLMFSYTRADDSKVIYTNDGAIITGTGFITLNNPDPLTFELEKYQQCQGELTACYKSLTPSGSTPPCELGFQKIKIIKFNRTLGFRDVITGSKLRFTLAPESRFGFPPDLSDGSFHYQVLELPKNCNVTIIGATDPNPGNTSNDPLKTAKLVTYVLAGLAGVILILAIACVIYCICCNRNRDASKLSAVPR